jgi:hypothetical protein
VQGALLLLVGFGFVALLLGFSRWLARRPWAAAGNLALAFLLFATAHHYWRVVEHLRSYEPLPRSAMVGQVYCERTGPGTFRVTLTRLPGGRMQVYELSGDQWHVEARTLVWMDRAAALGLPASFRFERLSTRQVHRNRRAATDAGPAGTTSYPLSDAGAVGEDFWSQARAGRRWAHQVEPRRVYGPWRPLADGARFDLWMTRDPDTPTARLEARPANEAAIEALL